MSAPDEFYNFDIMFLGGGLTGDETLSACGAKAMTWPGSPKRATFHVKRQGNEYSLAHTDCIADQLQGALRERFEMLAHHFSDIAVSMAKRGELDDVHNPAVKRLFTGLATGELSFVAQ